MTKFRLVWFLKDLAVDLKDLAVDLDLDLEGFDDVDNQGRSSTQRP